MDFCLVVAKWVNCWIIVTVVCVCNRLWKKTLISQHTFRSFGLLSFWAYWIVQPLFRVISLNQTYSSRCDTTVPYAVFPYISGSVSYLQLSFWNCIVQITGILIETFQLNKFSVSTTRWWHIILKHSFTEMTCWFKPNNYTTLIGIRKSVQFIRMPLLSWDSQIP
jgi:hypothetical protein